MSLWCMNWTHNQLQGYKFNIFLQFQDKTKPARDDQESLSYLRTIQSQSTLLRKFDKGSIWYSQQGWKDMSEICC
jgi:hypothetical protein